MQILSDIQPYNNPSKPVYKYRVWVSEDGLKRRHKVFKVKSTALDFINQSKAWKKGIDISSAESGEKQGFSALITPTRTAKYAPFKKIPYPKKRPTKIGRFFCAHIPYRHAPPRRIQPQGATKTRRNATSARTTYFFAFGSKSL